MVVAGPSIPHASASSGAPDSTAAELVQGGAPERGLFCVLAEGLCAPVRPELAPWGVGAPIPGEGHTAPEVCGGDAVTWANAGASRTFGRDRAELGFSSRWPELAPALGVTLVTLM